MGARNFKLRKYTVRGTKKRRGAKDARNTQTLQVQYSRRTGLESMKSRNYKLRKYTVRGTKKHRRAKNVWKDAKGARITHAQSR